MGNTGNTVRKPSFGFAVANIGIIIFMLMFGLLVLKLNLHILLVVAIAVASLFSMVLGHTWDQVLNAMINGVSSAMAAMFFFFLIGMAVAAWMISGCLPSLIYYGLNLISARIFLPTTFLLCSIVSLACGSSWTTGGTVGVVLLGIGVSMGFPEPLVVGTIIAGSYFGDKMSPISDTTNLASVTAQTDLFRHIGAMLKVTVPAWIISFFIYLILGLKHAGDAVSLISVLEFQNEISNVFNVNILVILPIIIVLIMSILRMPAIPTLIIGIFVAIPLGSIIQGISLSEIFNALQAGVSMDIDNAMVAKIVNRGGIQGMMKTFSLAMLALSLGGVVEAFGSVSVLVKQLVTTVKNTRLYPMFVIITAYLVVIATGEQYLGIVLTGQVYREVYDEAGYDRCMLSRNLEEGGTVSSPMVPWSTAGAYFQGTFGVATFAYAPYMFLNYITSILGCILPLLGLTLITTDKEKHKQALKVAKLAAKKEK